jgi:hypothetical protein
MREDMDKVIVERPRIGSRLPSRKKGYRKYVQNTGIDNLPSREPMLGRWRGRQRFLNEHLGPMRRFLRSRVGRPWNKVHQELCEHVSFDNAVQKHVLAHVFDYVQLHVEIQGRQIISTKDWQRGTVLRPYAMYVCPNSGLLKAVRRKHQTHSPQRVHVGKLTQYQQRDDTWWELKLRECPDEPGELWDVWLERPLLQLKAADLREAFGGKLTAISKRPLLPKEVRELHRSLRSQRGRKTKSRSRR